MKKIKLTTKKELNIYMSPVRQQLLRQLSIANGPLTPKMLSEKLQISPSSVQHHIRKLSELGVVELDHTELINGIKASYYRPADVTVQIGLTDSNELDSQREVLMENIVSEVYKGFRHSMHARQAAGEAINPDEPDEWGDIKSGVVHLTDQDARQLQHLITAFVAENGTPKSNSRPWEYALIFYKAEAGTDD